MKRIIIPLLSIVIIAVIVAVCIVLHKKEIPQNKVGVTVKEYLTSIHPTDVVWVGREIQWYTDDIPSLRRVSDLKGITKDKGKQYICVVINDLDDSVAIDDDEWKSLMELYTTDPYSIVMYYGNKETMRLFQYGFLSEEEATEVAKGLCWELSHCKDGDNSFYNEVAIGDIPQDERFNELLISQNIVFSCIDIIAQNHGDRQLFSGE